MLAHFFCLVEGKGEVAAVPVLLRRIAARVDPTLALRIATARVPRNQIVQPNVLESWVQRAAVASPGQSAVPVLIDSDDDCPAQMGPALCQRAAQARGDISLAVVLAKREFEAWFLAAAESVQGQRNLPNPLQAPPDPESIRGAKEWLSRQMPAGHKYSATSDQPALTAIFDMDLARQRSDSFDKCYRDIERRLSALVSVQHPPSESGANP
jgi:hypothetical protein